MEKTINQKVTNRKTINPKLFVLAAFLFSIAVSFMDAIIESFYFREGVSLADILFPPVGTPEFYMRIMLILTFTSFGVIMNYVLRKEIEANEELKKNELKFKTVANYTKDMDYWISPNKKMIFISPSTENLTGYKPEEFMKNINLLEEIVYEADREKFLNHESNSLKGENLPPLEFRIKRKDGEIIWVDHSCQSIFDEQGRYLGHRVSNRNITQRKNAEDELRWLSEELQIANKELEKLLDATKYEQHLLFSQSPYAKALLSSNFEFIEVNNAFENIFNISKGDIVGKKITDCELFNNPDIIYFLNEAKSRESIVKSHSIYIEEIDKMIIIDAYPLHKDSGIINRFVMNVEDLTDKIRAIEITDELNTQRRNFDILFEYLEFEKHRISRELHDGIGQKLLFIKMQIELLSSELGDNENKFNKVIDLLSEVHKEIRGIIYSLYPAELECYGLVESLQLLVDKFNKLSDIKYHINISGKYHRIDHMKELNIYRIFQEILNNTVKHSQADQVMINLIFAGDLLQANIADNGIGIDNDNTNKNSGYGLLSIKERINLLNGSLEINSKPNQGTEFIFEIPWEDNNEQNKSTVS